jgi:photosystem II stability/assembly factor-like uncharacterized protein
MIPFLLAVLLPLTAQAQWEALPGPYGGVLQSMTVTAQGRVLASQYAGSILTSPDGGVTWNNAWRDFWTANIADMITTPQGSVFAASYNGLYRSSEGLVWEKTSFIDIPTSLAFTSQGWLLVGTRGGIHVSEDDGDSWRSSVPIAGTNRTFKVAVSGDDTWFAGAYEAGIARSSDRGLTWLRINAGLPSIIVYSLTMVDGNILFAGLANTTYYSRDKGSTWLHAEGLDAINTYDVHRVSSTRLLAETGSGLYASSDDGASWTRIAATAISNVSALLVRDSASVLAAADGSLFRSSDQGETWERSDDGLHVPAISVLHIDRVQRLFAGSLISGLYRSLNGGYKWSYADSTYVPFAVTGMYSTSDRDLYVLTQDNGVRRSSDGGASWTELGDTGSGYDISALAENDAALIAADFNGTVFSSTNKGATWEELSTLQPVSGKVSRVQFLIRSEPRRQNILAATDRGLFLSGDGGGTWTLQPVTGINRDLIAVHKARNGLLYAATSRNVFVSGDIGVTWTEVYSSSSQGIKAFIASNRNSDVYIADDAMLQYSTDDGSTWRQLIAPPDLSTLIIDPFDYLIAGTQYSGVFRSRESTVSVFDAPAAAAADIALNGIAPQPMRSGGMLRVDIELAHAGLAQFRVYDLSGKLRAHVDAGWRQAGTHILELPALSLPAGSYLLQVAAGSQQASRRIVVLP